MRKRVTTNDKKAFSFSACDKGNLLSQEFVA